MNKREFQDRYVDVDLEPELVQVGPKLWLPASWSKQQKVAFVERYNELA